MTGTRALASDPDIVNASAEHSPPLVSVVSTGPRRVNVSKSNRRKHTSEKAAGKPKRNILFRMENQQLNVRVLVVPDSDFPMVNEQSALDVCGAGKQCRKEGAEAVGGELHGRRVRKPECTVACVLIR